MSNKILVTAKVNPDLDGTSCILAYSDLLNKQGKDAQGLVFGTPQSEVKYFTDKHNIVIPVRTDEPSIEWNKFVLVDASSIKGMPKPVVSKKVIEIIDHRKGEPEVEFPNAQIQNELIGAAATIVVERFIKAGLKPQPDHAKLLYGAIYHNSLNFIASNTSQKDKDAVKYLEQNFNLNEGLVREMFDYSTREVESDIKTALENDAKEFGTGWAIRAYQLIVWGSEVFAQKELIVSSVKKLMAKMGSTWSFINIVDLESKHSTIYASSVEGEQILSKALETQFTDGWATLPNALLRKQIMPKVNEVVEQKL